MKPSMIVVIVALSFPAYLYSQKPIPTQQKQPTPFDVGIKAVQQGQWDLAVRNLLISKSVSDNAKIEYLLAIAYYNKEDVDATHDCALKSLLMNPPLEPRFRESAALLVGWSKPIIIKRQQKAEMSGTFSKPGDNKDLRGSVEPSYFEKHITEVESERVAREIEEVEPCRGRLNPDSARCAITQLLTGASFTVNPTGPKPLIP